MLTRLEAIFSDPDWLASMHQYEKELSVTSCWHCLLHIQQDCQLVEFQNLAFWGEEKGAEFGHNFTKTFPQCITLVQEQSQTIQIKFPIYAWQTSFSTSTCTF